jgi:hypothetical protein
MYRLILPVVDFANTTKGWWPYFEFNQTSAHGTSQSVDIALLDDGEPRIMIEAKRASRVVGAEWVTKYLPDACRGVVTNGLDWVLCAEGRNRVVSIHRSSVVDIEALGEIVGFIRGDEVSTCLWSEQQQYVRPSVRPVTFQKQVKARRGSHPVSEVRSCDAFRSWLAALATGTPLDRLFLSTLVEQLERHGGVPGHLRIGARDSRVSFFDRRISDGSKRVARLELGRRQPDVLVLTSLAAQHPDLVCIVPPTPHDKGEHMRRFRLASDVQTVAFANQLGLVLHQSVFEARD